VERKRGKGTKIREMKRRLSPVRRLKKKTVYKIVDKDKKREGKCRKIFKFEDFSSVEEGEVFRCS
jgi:hypothetical protein